MFPPRTVRRPALAGILVLTALAAAAPRSQAAISDLTWGDPEIIDSGVSDVGAVTQGAGGDYWHVAYPRDGQIWTARYTAAGWQPPEQVSPGAADAACPALVVANSVLHVVWQDNRTGHPEIWTRRWDGAAWSAEECLTDDTVPSRKPGIAATNASGTSVLVVWEEGSTPTSIVSRVWSGGTWGSATAVSLGLAAAADPVVTANLANTYVAWSDARHGEPEIYLRHLYSGVWSTETRVTSVSGACQKPSILVQTCCGDYVHDWITVAFENVVGGVTESWMTCFYHGSTPGAPVRVSPNDGHSSVRPRIGGFVYDTWQYGLYGSAERRFLTWTEAGAPGSCSHRLARDTNCQTPTQIDTLTADGLFTSNVAAREGAPHASVIALWVEDQDGQPALIGRRSTTLGCLIPDFHFPARLLLAPAGWPTNDTHLLNDCGGTSPLVGWEVVQQISPLLDQELTWDAQQVHPNPPAVWTDSSGTAVIVLRGGGCAQASNYFSNLIVNGVGQRMYTGAKSPDVDGDCAVGEDDLAYVQSMLGTTDFCADLDGSGTVTDDDVAVVEATLGDLCSQLVGVGDPPPSGVAAGAGLGLRLAPNPSTTQTAVRFESPGREDGSVQVHDAAGRLVQVLATGPFAPGVQVLTWDLRRMDGSPAPSGVYFVSARAGTRVEHRTLLVTR